MSWPDEEWKVGLSPQALRAVLELEQRLERLQKESRQKQVQLDTLEAVMYKERQKHEEERSTWALLSQQNRSLAEARDQTESARQRLAQELQAKEAKLSCLEAQIAQAARRQAELEEELRRCQAEVEKSQSRPPLALPPPRWASPTLAWPEGGDGPPKDAPKGGVEGGAELSQTFAAGNHKIRRSSSALGAPLGKETSGIGWPGESRCPSAPPASPVSTENGEGVPGVLSEGKLRKDNEDLRLAVAKAEFQAQEKEKELQSLRGQLELARSELARWKKSQGDAAGDGVGIRELRGRRFSEDVNARYQTRHGQKGIVASPKVAPCGRRHSVSPARLELPAEKQGPVKLKGLPQPRSRAESTDRSQEELQALRAEVLTLRRRLNVSESQRKTLLEASWQQQKSQLLAQERQVPVLGTAARQKRKVSREVLGRRTQALALEDVPGLGKAEEDGKMVATKTTSPAGMEMEAKAEEKQGLEREGEEVQVDTTMVLAQAQGEVASLAGAENLLEVQVSTKEETCVEEKPAEPEETVGTTCEDLQALATGKAQAEAQASFVQQKLENLQVTLGRQTERLAQAMETQSRHVEELLADMEEKDRLMECLSRELEETKEALEAANAEGQRLRQLLDQREGQSLGDDPTDASGVGRASEIGQALAELQEGEVATGDRGSGRRPSEDRPTHPNGKEQLEALLTELRGENEALRKELALCRLCHQGLGRVNPAEFLGSGDGRDTEAREVPTAAQKRELLSQGRRCSIQTQTEGPEGGQRRRELVSVAFDDTQYEPYGLPEVVMKGFADIPSGPSCPYVLRRGILGNAPVGQLAPRAEPEEDSLETEEGTGV